jgi:hypothetical protein
METVGDKPVEKKKKMDSPSSIRVGFPAFNQIINLLIFSLNRWTTMDVMNNQTMAMAHNHQITFNNFVCSFFIKKQWFYKRKYINLHQKA